MTLNIKFLEDTFEPIKGLDEGNVKIMAIAVLKGRFYKQLTEQQRQEVYGLFINTDALELSGSLLNEYRLWDYLIENVPFEALRATINQKIDKV